MLLLAPEFYETKHCVISETDRLASHTQLKAIYCGNEPINYTPETFIPCKAQLMTLLTFIIEKTANTIPIFAQYRIKVDALTPAQSHLDIKSTLLFTKQNLEEKLLFIINNHKNIDLNVLK